MAVTETRTTCPYCGVGCGVLARVSETGEATISGDPDHPANFGRLCSKGAALAETLDGTQRLLRPHVHGKPVDWDSALNTVADGIRDALKRYGPESVAFYVSGQLLTEDYYVANKLMKGFLGSANIDTNSRLCMASAVAGHKRAFGSDTVPGCYEDLERAKLVVLVGSNTAWCHPVIYQRLVAIREKHPEARVVLVDPRRTASAELADVHLPLAPGTDAVLFNGLLVYLEEHDETHSLFVANHTEGVSAALEAARATAPSIARVAEQCGLSISAVQEFYELFARSERVVTLFSQGVNQTSSGTDKVNAIINCHLLTGRIGRPGMGPFSMTGQPNAMGGREVGGLANQLAAHFELESPEHRALVQDFWKAPTIATHAGPKAVEMFEAVEAGKIKVLWIMATNPAVSMPNAGQVHRALEKCPLVIVSDCVQSTDTARHAHVLLPASAWGEKDGTVTNSERRISRQRAFRPPMGDAKPDWWIMAEIAKRLGYGNAFDYENPAAIFREHASLSAVANDGKRDFDLSGLTTVSDEAYAELPPLQWPVTAAKPKGTVRLFGDGLFYTPSRKARFVPIIPRQPANPTDVEYPFSLNTGRVRDHWHTLTRTGLVARLSAHTIEPCLEIHPEDAARCRVTNGTLAEVVSPWGKSVARVQLTDTQRRGSVFVPMHWSDQFGSSGSIDRVVNPATDPISGEPEFKHTPVRVEPLSFKWYGFLLSRRQLIPGAASYWVSSRGAGLWRYELAGDELSQDWASAARAVLCAHDEKIEWIEYFDKAAQRYRGARLTQGKLESCIFIGPTPELPSRDWLSSLFALEKLDAPTRTGLLAGIPPKGSRDTGRQVCACFAVGEATIREAIQSGCTTTDELGKRLKAGTNCGSCLPELKVLLTQHTTKNNA